MIKYLADMGRGCLLNGYNIIPIQPGEKYPSVKDWRGKPTTKAMLDSWTTNGRASHGIGFTTDKTPFVDIDIRHHATNRYMVDWCNKNIGLMGRAPERIGNLPKCGLLYRCSKPFKKIASKEYIDSNGDKAQVEIPRSCWASSTRCPPAWM